MIHHLTGTIVADGTDHLVVEVGGIGYRVHTSRATREAYARRSEPATFYTHLHWGEQGPSLYGFHTPQERELFELLLTVSGVGPRLAIGILGATTPDRLQEAILSEQVEPFDRIKGVGRKTAERLILELREAVAELPLGTDPESPSEAELPTQRDQAALEALTGSLGFGDREARRALAHVRAEEGDVPTEALIRHALSYLGRGR